MSVKYYNLLKLFEVDGEVKFWDVRHVEKQNPASTSEKWED